MKANSAGIYFQFINIRSCTKMSMLPTVCIKEKVDCSAFSRSRFNRGPFRWGCLPANGPVINSRDIIWRNLVHCMNGPVYILYLQKCSMLISTLLCCPFIGLFQFLSYSVLFNIIDSQTKGKPKMHWGKLNYSAMICLKVRLFSSVK